MNKRKAIRDPHTQRSDHVLGEEVARDERVDMEPDELLPGGLTGFSPALRRGGQSFILQDSPDRGSAEPKSELTELTDNTAVSPSPVLLGQADDEFSHVADDLRSADTFRFAPFPWLRHPAPIRPRRDDADHVGNIVVEFLADCQQPGAILRARDVAPA